MTRPQVVDAAARLAEAGGIEALTMRKLAAELGVGAPTIYWHVGNKAALVDELVQQVIAEVGELECRGTSAPARLESLARSLRRKLLRHPHLIGLVQERGLTAVMFAPAQRAIARELKAARLPARQAAAGVWSILWWVISAVLLERTVGRLPEPHPPAEDVWADADTEIDAELAAHLRARPTFDEWFDHSIERLIASLLRENREPA